MPLLDDIRKDMFSASKAGNTSESEILKMVLAVVKNEEISKGDKLSEDEIVKVLRKESKKIQDSINEFTKMNRNDLVEKEKSQLEVLEKYLPALLDESKVREIVKKAVETSNAQDMRDMGKVMGIAMKELNGKADGNKVREIVQELLS
ncbi:aspartyl-tRNA amidotransferase [Candidatus Dojkabacteria bacterium HGW-Dojkabacteria-1]|uniref:Aspartyl-tRNA amidotransferase n=1 Tax=Candidatus Dojkabacteria bacterium HGW-Dojkabacteria-1 TaxID=2013761 RepID=A0A2N2F4D9_9BACT|nr:MAG: aspartyl-tRNA amidotransferase [Candidatus Dojkabacteria bacterium HGW-Dojkabacteria-1]